MGSYTADDTRLLAVDNGTARALFLCESSGSDATVSAAEPTLQGVGRRRLALQQCDCVFG